MTSPRYHNDPAYRAHIQALVAAAPPLTPEQRHKIAILLRPKPAAKHQQNRMPPEGSS